MRLTTRTLLPSSLLIAVASFTAFAQGTMHPTGGGYYNLSADSAGTTIYATSYADSNAVSGNFPNCYHHLQASVTSTSDTGAPGASNGNALTQVHASSSGSIRKDDSIGWDGGSDYTLSINYQAWCDCGGGTFVNTSLTEYVALKRTTGRNTRGYQDVPPYRYCGETPYCPPGVTPACGDGGWTDIESVNAPCLPQISTVFLATRLHKTDEYNCIGASTVSPGPGICDK